MYALQDLPPGLEKVYFTLQEELLKPQTQIKFGGGDTIEGIVRQPVIPAGRQQIAEVLLTSVKLPLPQRWEVNPAIERQHNLQGRTAQIAQALYNVAWDKGNVVEFDKFAQTWGFRKNVLAEMVKNGQLHPTQLDNGFGGRLTLEELAKLEKSFSAENLAKSITTQLWAMAVPTPRLCQSDQGDGIQEERLDPARQRSGTGPQGYRPRQGAGSSMASANRSAS